MKICKCCQIEKPLTAFYKRKRGALGVDSQCKLCVNAANAKRAKVRYQNDPEFRAKMAAYQKKYFSTEKGREANLRATRAYVATPNGRAVTREANKAYKKLRPAEDCARVQARNARKLMAMPAWSDVSAIKALYSEAQKRTKETGVPHEVDHIVPLRSPFVSGLHVPANLRVITATENGKKSNAEWPDMPDDLLDVALFFKIKGRGTGLRT